MTVVPISLGFIPSSMVGAVVKLRKHTMQWSKRQSHSGGGWPDSCDDAGADGSAAGAGVRSLPPGV